MAIANPKNILTMTHSKAKTWDYIASSFKDNREMFSLIQHIISSGLSNRLYGVISLDRLILSIYDQIEIHREALHVRFDIASEKWEFKYFSVPYKPPEFERSYERDKGIEKFNAFIKMINW
jgi:hypothetical protein